MNVDELPSQPGIITIRGARQIGKSTWLELQLNQTIEDYGLGSAFFLNFVLPDGEMYEVKSGATSAQEFLWFTKVFPKKRLNIISDSIYETTFARSQTLLQFLLAAPSDLYFDSDKLPWT